MGHGKETPRQKMIGMMYLFLTAMLALNVSKDILDSFVLVDEGLYKTTTNFAAKNASTYAEFAKQKANAEAKVAPWEDKALKVRAAADRLVADLQDLKIEIVRQSDGAKALALRDTTIKVWNYEAKKFDDLPSASINDALIGAKDNTDIPANIMIVGKKGEELQKKIEEFRNMTTALVSDNHPEVKAAIEKSLSTDAVKAPGHEGGTMPWDVAYFEHLPLIAVITNLTKFQSDVRNVEADITTHLLSNIDAGSVKVNKIEALVLAPSNYILQGGQYEAQVVLAALDTLQKPEVYIGPVTSKRLADGTMDYSIPGGGTLLKYDAQGRAMYHAAANNVGNFPWGGILQMTNPDGTVIKRPYMPNFRWVKPMPLFRH